MLKPLDEQLPIGAEANSNQITERASSACNITCGSWRDFRKGFHKWQVGVWISAEVEQSLLVRLLDRLELLFAHAAQRIELQRQGNRLTGSQWLRS